MKHAEVHCAFAIDVRKVPEQLLVDYQVRKLFSFEAYADDLFKLFAGHSASSVSWHTGGVQSLAVALSPILSYSRPALMQSPRTVCGLFAT